jgi:exonuclease III
VGGDGGNDSVGIIFISVYLPTGSQGEPYRCRLREELAQLREKLPRDTVVVAKDWNLDKAQLDALLRRWRCVPDVDIAGPYLRV